MDHNTDNTNLQQALNFTDQDLELNKAGQLSESQKKMLADKFASHMKIVKWAMLGVIVLGVIMLFREGDELINHFGLLNFLLVFGGIALLCYVPMFYYIKKKNNDILAGKIKVESVSGPVELSSKEVEKRSDEAFVMNFAGSQMVTCLIKINGKKIYAEEKVFQAFKDGQHYNIYYLTQSRGAYLIVSAEKI